MDLSDLGSAIDDSFETTIFPGGCGRWQPSPSELPRYCGRQSGHWNVSSSIGSGIDDRCPTVRNNLSTILGTDEDEFQRFLLDGSESCVRSSNLLSRLNKATKRDREERICTGKADGFHDDLTDSDRGSRKASSKLTGKIKFPVQSKRRGFYLPHENLVADQRAHAKGRTPSPPLRADRRMQSYSRPDAPIPDKGGKMQLAPVKREASQRRKDAMAAARIMLASALHPADFMRATVKDEDLDKNLDGGYSRPSRRGRCFATVRDVNCESEAFTSSSSNSFEKNNSRRVASIPSSTLRQSNKNSQHSMSTKNLCDAILKIDANSSSGSLTNTNRFSKHDCNGGWCRSCSNSSKSTSRPDSGGIPKNNRPTIFAGRGWVSPHPLSVTPSEHAIAPQARVKTGDGKEVTYEEFKAMQASGSIISEGVRSVPATLAGSIMKQLKMPWDKDEN
ncbi:hypothetical protein M433DRAFT_157679 [Acidomyces richmondensis BFW]|nr:hypothetical protein M433DRAFT_157679 [Acidomyces richmondensis BFW]